MWKSSNWWFSKAVQRAAWENSRALLGYGLARISICRFLKGAFLHAQGFISNDPMTQHTSALIMEVSSLARAKKGEFLTNYWKAGENMGWFSGKSFFSWKRTITTASGLADAVSWAAQKPQQENRNGENISTETLKLLCHKNNWQKLPELEIKGRLQNGQWQALSPRRTEPCGEADEASGSLPGSYSRIEKLTLFNFSQFKHSCGF